MNDNSFSDLLPIIPRDLYDPSELVLIGSHLLPAPAEGDGTLTAEEEQEAIEARRTGHLRVRSDFCSILKLEAIPVKDRKASESTKASPASDESDPTIALIYAYGYEGHLYRIAKPRIMIVEGSGEPYTANKEQDPSEPLTGKLYMWRLSKHQQTISIEVESGELENLVLEANKPGNRSVSAYAAHMQMAHRGGKLS